MTKSPPNYHRNRKKLEEIVNMTLSTLKNGLDTWGTCRGRSTALQVQRVEKVQWTWIKYTNLQIPYYFWLLPLYCDLNIEAFVVALIWSPWSEQGTGLWNTLDSFESSPALDNGHYFSKANIDATMSGLVLSMRHLMWKTQEQTTQFDAIFRRHLNESFKTIVKSGMLSLPSRHVVVFWGGADSDSHAMALSWIRPLVWTKNFSSLV